MNSYCFVLPHWLRWLCIGLLFFLCPEDSWNFLYAPVYSSTARTQLLEPQDDCSGSGMLVAISASKRKLGVCPLQHTDVKADISGFVARVTVRQHYHNPYRENIEAVYTFPLPEKSAVDQMTMKIGNRLIKGTIKKREEAKEVYERAKTQGQLATLLDQERPNIFTQSVANIEPGENVDVEISYLDVLQYENGEFSFKFPTVVGPRFIPRALTGTYSGSGRMSATSLVPDASRVSPPIIAAEGERAGHDISISVDINAGVPINNLHSKLHDVDVKLDSQTKASVKLKNKDRIPNKDFVMVWSVASESIKSGCITHNPGGDGFFTLLLIPPKKVTPESITPKEIIFLIDCSGSQMGRPIEKAKEAIEYILTHLNKDDTFRILAFNNDVTEFSKRAEKNSSTVQEAALDFLHNLRAEGGTWMAPAVERVCALPRADHRLRLVVFMTDGFVGNDFEVISLVKKYRGETRWFPFGTGNSTNRFLIDKIAEEGGGEADYVLLNAPAEAVGKKFYDRISSPVLTDIKLECEGFQVSDVFPKSLSDLWAQRPLIFSGKYQKPAGGKFVLTGFSCGKPYRQELELVLPEAETRNDSIKSIWARAKVEQLMSQNWLGVQKGEMNEKLRQEIVDTALKHHIMSQFTSFVAVEEGSKGPNKAPCSIPVPVELPEGVSSVPYNINSAATTTWGGTTPSSSSIFGRIGKFFSGSGLNPFVYDGTGGAALHQDGSRLLKDSESGTNAYYIAGGACQPFFLEDDSETMMLGEKGSSFKTDARNVELQQGKIVAIVARRAMKISTKLGEITIPPNSAVIVRVTAEGILRLANLCSQHDCILKLVKDNSMKMIAVPVGEEVCLAGQSIVESELIPLDGVDRSETTVETAGSVKIARSKFDRKAMVEKEKLLICNAGSFYQAKLKVSRLKFRIEKECANELIRPLEHSTPKSRQ